MAFLFIILFLPVILIVFRVVFGLVKIAWVLIAVVLVIYLVQQI